MEPGEYTLATEYLIVPEINYLFALDITASRLFPAVATDFYSWWQRWDDNPPGNSLSASEEIATIESVGYIDTVQIEVSPLCVQTGELARPPSQGRSGRARG